MTRAWMLALLCAAGMAGQSGQGRKAMELELKIAKTQFIVKESLRIEVVVHNNGASAVAVPAVADNRNHALSYHLNGPTFPKEFVFEYAKAGGMTLPGEPAKVSVAPGAKLAVPLSIEKQAKDWKAGHHTLHAVLKLGSDTIKSNSISFDIVHAEVKSGQVIMDAPTAASGPYMRAVFLATLGSGNHLYQGFFQEAKPDVDTTPQDNFVEAFEIPAAATSVASLWANFDRTSVMAAPRYGWLNGPTAAVQEFQSPPVTFDLGGAKLLRPGLTTREGDALFVSYQSTHVTLTKVPRAGAAAKVWDVTLPFAAADGRVWITQNGTVTVILTAERSNNVSLFLVQDGKVVATTEIERAALVPQSEPALAISADGTLRASVLVADPDNKRTISIAGWEWKPGEAIAAPKREPAATLAQDPKAAAVIYAFAPGIPWRDWVILLGGDVIVTSRSPARPRLLEGSPILPLQLLPRAQTSYLLVKHPKEIVYLAPMF